MQVDVEKSILINELQLGEKLGECVHTDRRADFSLLLAMLTEDVREHSQFNLPVIERNTDSLDEQQLRKEFNLPNKAPLVIEKPNDLSCFNQATKIIAKKLTAIHLEDALQPKACSFYNDAKRISSEILSNAPLFSQKKYQSDNKQLNKRSTFNAKEWLQGIQTSVVKAPLMSV